MRTSAAALGAAADRLPPVHPSVDRRVRCGPALGRNVLTFGDAFRGGFRWDFFLLEPLIFVLWPCCGGADLRGSGGVLRLAVPVRCAPGAGERGGATRRVPQVTVPFWLHERLRALKFVIFLAWISAALGSMAQAQRLAELQPFKTAIVLRSCVTGPLSPGRFSCSRPGSSSSGSSAATCAYWAPRSRSPLACGSSSGSSATASATGSAGSARCSVPCRHPARGHHPSGRVHLLP